MNNRYYVIYQQTKEKNIQFEEILHCIAYPTAHRYVYRSEANIYRPCNPWVSNAALDFNIVILTISRLSVIPVIATE